MGAALSFLRLPVTSEDSSTCTCHNKSQLKNIMLESCVALHVHNSAQISGATARVPAHLDRGLLILQLSQARRLCQGFLRLDGLSSLPPVLFLCIHVCRQTLEGQVSNLVSVLLMTNIAKAHTLVPKMQALPQICAMLHGVSWACSSHSAYPLWYTTART